MNALYSFKAAFHTLTGFFPFRWQERLYERLVTGDIPLSLDLPTGLGKTSVMAIWLIARAEGAVLPRRLVYVVDRRAVVDQATKEAEKLRAALEGKAAHFDGTDPCARTAAAELKKRLGFGKERQLPISTLRGAHADNREWLANPAAPAIIVGTVDMIGSRLLFEGYGVSRKTRPYQAGLLGTDTLIVLDEAHLVPPFAHLLRAIEQNPSFRPKAVEDRALLPRFVVLPLSATQRDPDADEPGRKAFRLEAEDWTIDLAARKRIEATKRLRLQPLTEGDQDKQLGRAAWELAEKDGEFFRVVVFCDRRDKIENGEGPSAQGIKEAIENLAKGDRKAGRNAVDIHSPELLVGARRVHERKDDEKRLRALGFIGDKTTVEKRTFLIATSAGEVGVDIDADHMVSDLVAWERMVQRLGRVNRRGEGDAEIRVFWMKPSAKDPKSPTGRETRALIAFGAKAVLEKLPQSDGAFDASPWALRGLSERARDDAALRQLIDAATTPEPLRPALNRALVDAWSMTSLETHTGRPDVAPWLRGWVDDLPQTTVVWRTHLPVRVDAGGRPILQVAKEIEDFFEAGPPKTTLVSYLADASVAKEIEDFFEAGPPQQSEKLETETFRVATWLQKRARELLKVKQIPPEQATDPDAENPSDRSIPRGKGLRKCDIVALTLSSDGSYAGHFTLRDLERDRKGTAEKDKFEKKLIGKTLIIDARFGGLSNGLLDADGNAVPETADGTDRWSRDAKFRVRRNLEGQDNDWRREDVFDLRRNDEGAAVEWLVIEHFREAAKNEDARSISRPQELSVHQDWARNEMVRIAKAVGLPDVAVKALALGARLHDEGKKASHWQRAFKAQRDAERFGLAGPLAKTMGPIDFKILNHYRHEFGSLPDVERDPEFQALPEDWRDLVLHLVAAHHGQARPWIETRGCEDGPPSLLADRAAGVALRFARLQKRWGPWGLAWWEALLRAADQIASRDNDECSTQSTTEGA